MPLAEVKFTTDAPEGASHYAVSGRAGSFSVTWYRQAEGVWFYFANFGYKGWRPHGVFTPAGLVRIL